VATAGVSTATHAVLAAAEAAWVTAAARLFGRNRAGGNGTRVRAAATRFAAGAAWRAKLTPVSCDVR